jgi:replicative DNA helicase
MPDLISRAEEALLGALIADPDQLADVPGLEAADFTDPVRQAVWTAISRLREVAPGARGPEFADVIHATSNDDLITYDYLARLAVAAPTPGAADAYARMVMEASFLRGFAADIAQLPEADQGNDTTLRDAIASFTRNINAARSAAADDLREPGPPPADPHAVLEEQYLSAILHQPGLTDWIPLEPAIFTSPGRLAIYQAITALSRHGGPVDEITLPWALARATATVDAHAGRTTTAESFAATIPPGTIARLAATSIDTMTALDIGRDLLADHAYAQITAAARGAEQHHLPESGVPRTTAPHRNGLASDPARPLLQPPPGQQLQPGPQLRQEGS